MGRKPKPTALKRLAGNPGRRPLNEREPIYFGDLLPPKDLGEVAREQWLRWAEQLSAAKVVTPADAAALTVMSEVWARYVEAQDGLKRTGMLVKAPSGYPIINPLLSVVNQCTAQLTKLFAEFGLTPSSRSKVSTLPGGGPDCDFLNV